MAATASPIYGQTASHGAVTDTSSGGDDSSLDAPATAHTIATASALGAKVFEVVFQSAYTEPGGASGIARLFIGTSAAASHLFDEVLLRVSQLDASQDELGAQVARRYDNLILGPNELLMYNIAGTSSNWAGHAVYTTY